MLTATGASGSTLQKNAYDPYGVTGTSNTGRFQYTGQSAIPELRLYYYKARFYDPGLGRFMQTDPIGYDDDVNLYAYVGNDPLNRADPTGTCEAPIGTRICRDRDSKQTNDSSAGQSEGTANRRELEEELGVPTALPDAARTVAEGASATGDVVEETYKAGVGGGIFAGILRFLRIVKTVSRYEDITLAGSRVRNIATDVSKAQFERNLVESGFTRTISRDGKVIILERDGARYVLRDAAKSTGGPTADFYKAGSTTPDLKIRLEQAQ